MIIGKDFIYLHFPKTGGTFTRHIIEYCNLGKHDYSRSAHCSLEGVNKNGKTIISSIRNPWDWYVSFWKFRHDNNKIWTLDKQRNSKVSFDKYLGNLLNPTTKQLQTNTFINGTNINVFKDMETKQVGLMSLYWKYICFLDGKDQVDYYFRTESLTDDIINYFKLLGKAKRICKNTPNQRNATIRNKDYKTYYTEELATLVYEKDKELIDRFNYTFNGNDDD